MATQEEKVIHYARKWRETEKSAMGATGQQKELANSKHTEAKENLREAVDRLNRSES